MTCQMFESRNPFYLKHSKSGRKRVVKEMVTGSLSLPVSPFEKG